jgi:hypothetical protein
VNLTPHEPRRGWLKYGNPPRNLSTRSLWGDDAAADGLPGAGGTRAPTVPHAWGEVDGRENRRGQDRIRRAHYTYGWYLQAATADRAKARQANREVRAPLAELAADSVKWTTMRATHPHPSAS